MRVPKGRLSRAVFRCADTERRRLQLFVGIVTTRKRKRVFSSFSQTPHVRNREARDCLPRDQTNEPTPPCQRPLVQWVHQTFATSNDGNRSKAGFCVSATSDHQRIVRRAGRRMDAQTMRMDPHPGCCGKWLLDWFANETGSAGRGGHFAVSSRAWKHARESVGRARFAFVCYRTSETGRVAHPGRVAVP